ncbi:MAG: ABC transporter permease [Verrucomicrobiales bacterium]|nr:ABC transporter permease [Verrucomicrobiales bacterium]
MKRILGILILLLVVYVATWIFSDLTTGRTSFLTGFNQENLLRRTALFGILGIGVAFVIITGGIDLSVGSVVCLVGVGFPWMAVQQGWPVWLALGIVVILPVLIGYGHGLLVTKLNLQPFIVTLCGLLMYRGITRGFTGDQTAGFQNELKGLRWLANGEIPIYDKFGIPVPLIILAVVATLAAVFLNKTIYGRYLLALGNNEEAAKFSGIDTDKMKIIAYVICSSLAGLGGLLFVMDTNSAQPVDFGNFYELYAIAAAVLGGCSLRGGTGTIIGVLIGTALLQLLKNMIILVDQIKPNIEFAVIGAVILAGAIGDEVAKKVVAKRNAAA